MKKNVIKIVGITVIVLIMIANLNLLNLNKGNSLKLENVIVLNKAEAESVYDYQYSGYTNWLPWSGYGQDYDCYRKRTVTSRVCHDAWVTDYSGYDFCNY